MAATAAERKAKERQLKKEQGMALKQIWLSADTIKLISQYKSDHKLKSDDEAINALIQLTAH